MRNEIGGVMNMHWLFWALLIAGILLVIWPFFAAVSTGVAIFLWILGALLIIAAFFVLPAWWARPAVSTAGPSGYAGEETTGPGAIFREQDNPAFSHEYRAPKNPPEEPPPGERRNP
ncbi:MAG: hypothetical protein ACYDCO_19860 [Armatimonadota bacterium]